MDQFFWERKGRFDLGRLLCRLPDGVWLIRNPMFLCMEEVEQSAVAELPAGDGDKCDLLSQRTLLKLIERVAIAYDWTQLYFFEGEHAPPAAGFGAARRCLLVLHRVDGALWQVESHDPELIQYLGGAEAGFHPGGTWHEMPRHPVVAPVPPPAAEQTRAPLAASLAPPLGAQEAARIRQGWERMFALGCEIDTANGVVNPPQRGTYRSLRFGLGASAHDIARVILAWRLLRLLLPHRLREALEDKLRPWAEKRKFYLLIPERELPRKQRIAAPPGSITALWYEIEDLNRARDKSVKWMFEPGADEKYLRTLETKLGFALPPDLRELFSACAACNLPFGGNESDDRYTGFDSRLIPSILERMQLRLSDGYKLRLYPGTIYPEPGPRLVPIGGGNTWAHHIPSPSVLCYDLNPGVGGTPGQIVHVDMPRHACRVVAPSLHTWLEKGLERLKGEVA